MLALRKWLHRYNHDRAHTALGGFRPANRVTNPSAQYTAALRPEPRRTVSVCPFGNQSHRYDARFPGRYTGGPNKATLHTTEGRTLPGYAGGSEAPHFTVLPDVATRTVTYFQHFDTSRPSRALANKSGGVQTNNDGTGAGRAGRYLRGGRPRAALANRTPLGT